MKMLALTWYHKFDEKWHMATEGYYMWQRKVPNLNSPNSPPTILGSNGAQCAPENPTCRASVNAMINYLVYKVSPKDFVTLRNGFFKDSHGQRTGYKTLFSEHLIGWTHWIGDVITIRPEFRFDRSYDTKAYDGGREANQYVLATDLIIHF